MKPISIAVVGLGRTGWRNHLVNLRSLPEQYTIAGVVDALEDRRKDAESEFNCRSYATLEDLLSQSAAEWVVIATPQTLHCDQVIAALQAGRNVVCEKPMATHLNEAEKMARVAKDENKHLSVFHNLRYSPDFQLVENVIQSGKLGRILMIKIYRNSFSRRWDWQTLKKFGGGNLANLGPHILDHALCLMGAKDPNVVAQMESAITLGDADDHVKVILTAEGHPLMDIEMSSVDATGADRWKIYGTSGGLSGDGTTFRCKFFDPSALPHREVVETPSPDRTYNKEEIPWEEETLTVSEEDAQRPLPIGYYKALYSALSEGKPPPITLDHSVSVMRLMHNIQANSI